MYKILCKKWDCASYETIHKHFGFRSKRINRGTKGKTGIHQKWGDFFHCLETIFPTWFELEASHWGTQLGREGGDERIEPFCMQKCVRNGESTSKNRLYARTFIVINHIYTYHIFGHYGGVDSQYYGSWWLVVDSLLVYS